MSALPVTPDFLPQGSGRHYRGESFNGDAVHYQVLAEARCLATCTPTIYHRSTPTPSALNFKVHQPM
jgi:hypothetical protein